MVDDTNGQDAFDALLDKDFVKIADMGTIGNTHHGLITDALWVQERAYNEDKPGQGDLLYWRDKKPSPIPSDDPKDRVMALHIVFQTDESEDDEDDGRRKIVINKYQLDKSFTAAWKAADSKPRIGAWVRFTRIEDVKPRKGINKARGFEVLYKTAERYAEEGPSDSAFSGAGAVSKRDEDNPFA